MKLRPCSRLQRFTLVNPLLFVFNTVINTHFSSPVMIFLRNGSFFCLEKDLLQWRCDLPYIFSLRVWGIQTSSLLTFHTLFQVVVDCGLRCVQGQVLILKYFCANCISPILLKHLDQGMMSIASEFISQSSTAKKKLSKPVSDKVVRNDILAISTRYFLSCFCDVFVIPKLPQTYMLNICGGGGGGQKTKLGEERKIVKEN